MKSFDLPFTPTYKLVNFRLLGVIFTQLVHISDACSPVVFMTCLICRRKWLPLEFRSTRLFFSAQLDQHATHRCPHPISERCNNFWRDERKQASHNIKKSNLDIPTNFPNVMNCYAKIIKIWRSWGRFLDRTRKSSVTTCFIRYDMFSIVIKSS